MTEHSSNMLGTTTTNKAHQKHTHALGVFSTSAYVGVAKSSNNGTSVNDDDDGWRKNVSVIAAIQRDHKRNAHSAGGLLHGDTMSEGMVNPCLQECERPQYDNMYNDIETMRSRLEELAFFQREVDTRLRQRRKAEHLGLGGRGEATACLAGLKEHSFPPRLLQDSVFCESNNFQMRRSIGRHHQNVNSSAIMQHSILVARTLTR
jgi:hypothetical protein